MTPFRWTLAALSFATAILVSVYIVESSWPAAHALVPGVVPQGQSMGNPTNTNISAWGNYQIGGGIGNQSVAFLDGGPSVAASPRAVKSSRCASVDNAAAPASHGSSPI